MRFASSIRCTGCHRRSCRFSTLGRRVRAISLDDLIAAKEALGRDKDLIAAKELRAIRGKLLND